MNNELLGLTLRIQAGDEADDQELDELTRHLRNELLEVDVRSVEPIRAAPPPPGTRAVDAMILGSLLVSLAKSPELLKGVVGVIQNWLAGSRARTVELQIGADTLKVGGISAAEQSRLIDLFVEKHTT
jgi:hypothetical protein